jgi:hypothetical protein
VRQLPEVSPDETLLRVVLLVPVGGAWPVGSCGAGGAPFSPAEARLLAAHVAASAIRRATLEGSPLLDLCSEQQRQQVTAIMRELARVLSSTSLSMEEPCRG